MNEALRIKYMYDGFASAMTGLGDLGLDKHATLVPQFVHLNPQQLSDLWRGDWVSRKIVQIPAADSTRMWRFWKADKKDIKKLEELERKFNVQQKLLKALIRARLYGGAAIIIGVNDGQDVSKELDLERCKKDCLKYLHVCSRYELSVGPLEYDPISQWYGKPKWYSANMRDPMRNEEPKKVHPSRVIHLIGSDSCDALMSLNNQGWGDSVLQAVYDAVSASGSTLQNIAHLIQEAKIDVVKTPDLQNQLTGEDSEAAFKTRWKAANEGKSLFKMLIIDKEEEWQRIGATFAGMPDIMDAMFLVTCAAADIPATRFMGQSPKGLNATGESDLANYYDKIKSDQEQDMSPAINQLDEVLIRSALGKRPDEVWYEWRPLWQISETEKAANEKTTAEMFSSLAATGLIPITALSEVAVNKFIEMGAMPGLEDAMAKAEAAGDVIEPPPSPEEEAALRVKEEGAMRELPPSETEKMKALAPPKGKSAGGPSGGGGAPPASNQFEVNQLRVDGFFTDDIKLLYLKDCARRLREGLPFIDIGTFEEHLHPRGGQGSGQGGQFISKGGLKETSAPQEGVGGGSGAAGAGGHQAAAPLKGRELEAKVQANVDAGSKAAEARGIKALEGSKGGHVGQISSRNVTAAGKGEKQIAELTAEKAKFGQPTVEAMKKNPEVFARDMNLFKNTAFYPNFKEGEFDGKSPTQIARAVVDHMKENLRFLYNKAQHLEDDKQWYDGARNIVDKRAAQYGLTDMAVAGVYAALSPQKDWDQNVYLGDRMIAIYTAKIKQSEWTPEMDTKATELGKKPDIKKVIESVRGKTLGELDSADKKGIWIRIYDEATSKREFASISSTGEYGEIMKNASGPKAGESSQAAWQTTPALASAVKALESGGNRDVISEAMGKQHKVRSFYNNILDPHSPNGDVTSDTHHVGAALLRPLGGSTVPVIHNFGNGPSKEQKADIVEAGKKLTGKETKFEGTGKSTTTGLSGTYALYGDATRELAAELKVEPRQLQSVVWTTKRTSFGDPAPADKEYADRAWLDYAKGAATMQETQAKVYSRLTATPQEKQASDLIERLQKQDADNRGFTYSVKQGKSPTEGYMVSPYKDRERVLDYKTLTHEDIAKYIGDNMDLLSKSKHNLGGWFNPEDGKLYLDVAVVSKTPEEATKLSQKNNQLAYYDLAGKKTVTVQSMEQERARKKEASVQPPGKAGSG